MKFQTNICSVECAYSLVPNAAQDFSPPLTTWTSKASAPRSGMAARPVLPFSSASDRRAFEQRCVDGDLKLAILDVRGRHRLRR